MIPTTPPSHTRKQRQWGQASGGCFLLLSSPVLPHFLSLPTFFPPCSLANSFSLQVKLISLRVDCAIFCLLYCFVCLSGNVSHKLGRLRLIPLRWLLRVSSRGLCFYWCFHCRTDFVVCMCVRVYMQAWACACLSLCVSAFSLSRLKWINSNHRKHSQKSSGVEFLSLSLFYIHFLFFLSYTN